MRTCPACGLELPAHARFCARCGARLPGEPAARLAPLPPWLLLLFVLAAVGSGLVAAVYAVLLVAPGLPGPQPGLSQSDIRLGAAVFTALGVAMFVLQVAATIGLLRRRPWGRLAATVACVAWILTCIGIPFSVIALSALWRTPSGGPTTMVR